MIHQIKRKKYILLLFAALLVIALSSCSSRSSLPDPSSGKLRIVTTIFPAYDWVLNVLGDDPSQAETTLLLDKGIDLHNFQPTAADMLQISSCDLFIYVGGASDVWAEDALKEAVNPDMIVIDLLSVLGDQAKEEEAIDGMQEEEEAEDGIEYDEHVWLSLKNAARFVRTIAASLSSLDPAHASVYEANAAAYIDKLNALDLSYRTTVENAARKTILFGDRFPFRYLTDDYGLTYFAAFAGCSAETEASFETISFLSQKVDELQLPAVLTIEGTDPRIAETIIQNTDAKNQKILVLDSMQTTSKKDLDNGSSYLSVMEQNLSVLKEALQ
ncbi:MAG: zinc ABC transporter substrate-binding protein [Lachnospiraceae bacterium]|nr:zinc ABC transporter substrate-binding protein [Lachnospiraceae bacterium]